MHENLAVTQRTVYNWPLAAGIVAATAASGLVLLVHRTLGEQQKKLKPLMGLVTGLFAFALVGDIMCVMELIAHVIDPTFVDTGA